jgi:hypothetical protein
MLVQFGGTGDLEGPGGLLAGPVLFGFLVQKAVAGHFDRLDLGNSALATGFGLLQSGFGPVLLSHGFLSAFDLSPGVLTFHLLPALDCDPFLQRLQLFFSQIGSLVGPQIGHLVQLPLALRLHPLDMDIRQLEGGEVQGLELAEPDIHA